MPFLNKYFPIILIGLNVNSFQAKPIDSLYQITNNCIRSSDVNLCKKALIKVEKAQLNAYRRSNFPCQTRLLSLEANMIMLMHQMGSKRRALKMVNEAEDFCNAF